MKLRTKLLTISLCFLSTCISSWAQEGRQLEAGKLIHSRSIKSSECPTDLHGNPCARVVVEIPLPEVKISGSFMLKNDEYDVSKVAGGYQFWVSTAPGSEKQEITISHDNYYSTKFCLICDGERLKGREEYKIVVNLPLTGAVIFITEGIENCIIEVDGKTVITNQEGKAIATLPIGNHSFTAKANGFIAFQDNVLISSNQIEEKRISLIPTDKHTEHYIKYRIKQIFDDYVNNPDESLFQKYASEDYYLAKLQYDEYHKNDEYHKYESDLYYAKNTDKIWFLIDMPSRDLPITKIEVTNITSRRQNGILTRKNILDEVRVSIKIYKKHFLSFEEKEEVEDSWDRYLTLVYDIKRDDWFVDDIFNTHVGFDFDKYQLAFSGRYNLDKLIKPNNSLGNATFRFGSPTLWDKHDQVIIHDIGGYYEFIFDSGSRTISIQNALTHKVYKTLQIRDKSITYTPTQQDAIIYASDRSGNHYTLEYNYSQSQVSITISPIVPVLGEKVEPEAFKAHFNEIAHSF